MFLARGPYFMKYL